MIFYPTLKSLKQKLKIQTINTGRQFTHNGDPSGIVFDDMEALYPVVGKDGYVKLRSGVEFTMTQYRGQNEDFGVCNTTLDRCKSVEEQFLNICRTIAFEELLETHPFVMLSSSILIYDNPLSINLTGIAQHYGLHTDYLDITNNFHVACFFATCKYENGKYYPIGNIRKAGVIYRINELFMTPPYFKSDVEIDYLGWQPLPRPEQQRANILKVSKDTNLDTVNGVQKYYFKHSISQSRKIWKMFDEGKTLFPDDSAADLANECSKLNSFTQKQIDKALERFKGWSEKTVNKDEVLDSLKIEIIEKNILSWDNLFEMDSLYWERKLDETISKVRFRFTAPQFAK